MPKQKKIDVEESGDLSKQKKPKILIESDFLDTRISLRRSTRQAAIKKEETAFSQSGRTLEEKLQDKEENVEKQSKVNLEEGKKQERKARIKFDNKVARNSPVTSKDSKSNVVEDFKQVSSQSQVKYVGAHVSVSGGLHNAIANALEIGAKSFGLFLRNQRQWNAKPLQDEQAELFKQACKDGEFSPEFILPHGIYLMNCASANEKTLAKSRAALVDELKRCEKLGLTLYNFHPGSTCGDISKDEGVERIAESINAAHKETKYVITLIENMCCQGHTIGGKFEELKAIIDQVEDKSRVGVCFDTCHAFAAGYDVSSKEAFDHTMDLFNKVIGMKYLRAVHLNDSKGDCACHLDRHENIGHGKIGLRGFKALMNDSRFNGIPMILETPETDYGREIRKLYSLVGQN